MEVRITGKNSACRPPLRSSLGYNHFTASRLYQAALFSAPEIHLRKSALICGSSLFRVHSWSLFAFFASFLDRRSLGKSVAAIVRLGLGDLWSYVID